MFITPNSFFMTDILLWVNVQYKKMSIRKVKCQLQKVNISF